MGNAAQSAQVREEPNARGGSFRGTPLVASLEDNGKHSANPTEDVDGKQKIIDTVPDDGIDNELPQPPPQPPVKTETCTSSSKRSAELNEIMRLQQDIVGLTSKVDQLHRLAVIENARDQRAGFLSAMSAALNFIQSLPILGQIFRLVLIANVVCLFKLLMDHDFTPAIVRKCVFVILTFVWKLLVLFFSPLIRELNSLFLSSYFVDLAKKFASYFRAIIYEGLGSGVAGGTQIVKNFAEGVLNSNIPPVADISFSDAVSDAATFFSWALNATGKALS